MTLVKASVLFPWTRSRVPVKTKVPMGDTSDGWETVELAIDDRTLSNPCTPFAPAAELGDNEPRGFGDIF